MKWATPQIMIVLILLLIAPEMFGQEFTFRGLPWGASIESVIAREGVPDRNINGMLTFYNKTVSGYNATLFMYVTEGLSFGRYLLDTPSSNQSDFIFIDLLQNLNIVYGVSSRQPDILTNDRYVWVISRTKITLIRLINSNGESTIYLDYDSPSSLLNEFGGL